MATKVCKYYLPIRRNIEVNIFGRILSADILNKELCLWAEHNDNVPPKRVLINVLLTDEEAPEDQHLYAFVNTVIQNGYVMHVFYKYT